MKTKLSIQLKSVKKFENLPIKYNADTFLPEDLKSLVVKNYKYIGICPLSKNKKKDLPEEVCIDLIRQINLTDYKVLLLGVGENMKNYSSLLKKSGCEYIDLVDKTTIPELAAVLKNCEGLISVDTGTMHLGCAVGVPVVALFYSKEMIIHWAPVPELYKSVVISENITAQYIREKLFCLINKEGGNV